MPKILIVDNDAALRGLLRERLEQAYDIAETGDFEEALEMALQFRPDCVLLDLIEPQLSGVEFCRKFASLSFAQSIPILVMTEEPVRNHKYLCPGLSVTEYIEKPVDCAQLTIRLGKALKVKHPERRREARIQLRVILKLCGLDLNGTRFELGTITEDVSATGFSCGLTVPLPKDAPVDVFLVTGGAHFVGRATVVRVGQPTPKLEHYAFRFVEKPNEWVIR